MLREMREMDSTRIEARPSPHVSDGICWDDAFETATGWLMPLQDKALEAI